MAFIYNAIESGWSVKKNEDKFTIHDIINYFLYKVESKKDTNLDEVE